MGKWTEIRCDYTVDDLWMVDAWLTDDPDEGCKVVATIDNNTARVTYYDNDAKTDKDAQEVIKAKLEEIRKGDE